MNNMRHLSWILAGYLFAATGPLVAAEHDLFVSTEPITPPEYLTTAMWRSVRLNPEALQHAMDEGGVLGLELFGGLRVSFNSWRTITNSSGSISWIGEPVGSEYGRAVIVFRDEVAVGSIRWNANLYTLAYTGNEDIHILYEVEESDPQYQEEPPTIPQIAPERLKAAEHETRRRLTGQALQDDGSIHDLLVVYSQEAMDDVGGVVAIENLIDLGVTETNMSYEFSGIDHRVNLVHTALTDYASGQGCPRDLLQNPNDGVMDEVHVLRNRYEADLVKLITAGGCGRAFIMNDISIAFEEFAFCYTSYICLTPGYTFQHELGHIQSGRHQRTAPQPDSPFTFNFGYTNPDDQFRTIMAAGDGECPNGCPRQLAWSNPDVNEPVSGVPMGIPDTDPLPADMRQALNAAAWTVANFRVSGSGVFFDGFESGDTSAWQLNEAEP